MTDQTQPEIPGAEAAVTPPGKEPRGPLGDNNDDPGKKPAKKAAKKAPAKKAAAAPEPAKPEKIGGIYLPSLPEGFAYTELYVACPDGGLIAVRPTDDGKSSVTVQTEDLTRTMAYADFPASVKSTASFARVLEKRAARKAELAALDAEFGD